MTQISENIPSDFPLSTYQGGYGNLLWQPSESLDIDSDWTMQFGIYTTPAKPGRVGGMRIRRASSGDTVTYFLQFGKNHANGRQKIAATIKTSPATESDPLISRAEYEFDAYAVYKDDFSQPIECTKVKKSCSYKLGSDGRTKIEFSGQSNSIDIDGPATLSWLLFETIARLAGPKQSPIDFTLIDHFDQIKPQGRIAWRSTATVAFGGKETELSAYDQIGRGVLPAVWWIAPNRWPLAYVAGIESYLLEPATTGEM